MAFADDMRRFKAKVRRRVPELHAGVVAEARRSIVEGSEITSAPGQPVQSGDLRRSYVERSLGPLRASITSDLVYAPLIEEGVGAHGPLQLRSAVGGWHSIKLTVAGMQRIVDVVTRRVAADATPTNPMPKFGLRQR